MATHLTLVKPGDVVIGVSASHQPSLGGPRRQSRGFTFHRHRRPRHAFKEVLQREPKVTLVVLTRLAVTYELLPMDAIDAIVRLAHEKGRARLCRRRRRRARRSRRLRSAAHAESWASTLAPPASTSTAP